MPEARARVMSRGLMLLAVLAVLPASAQAPAAETRDAAGTTPRFYQLDYQARFEPANGTVQMRITVRQPRDLLRKLRFRIDPERHLRFSGDGELLAEQGYLTWLPPAQGGTLRYSVVLEHERKSGGYDSMFEESWAVFRGDDLVPPATVTALKGAQAQARLHLSGPGNWSFISAYPKTQDGWYTVDWEDRAFDRPVGWMAAGRLGVRWGDVADTRVAVAGPVGHGIRRMDILAFLRWNLPTLVGIFPDFPRRLLIVSAGDPMWRGGLSGPNSIFLHAERPLISANGTSTLLHELMHISQSYGAERGEDWIVEAIAEYYTLEIMRRSGTLSGRRYERGHEKLEQWGSEAEDLVAEHSSGSRTARGVTILQQLDTELRELSGGKYSLDDVARQLAADGAPVGARRLREVASALAGKPLKSLSPKNLD